MKLEATLSLVTSACLAIICTCLGAWYFKLKKMIQSLLYFKIIINTNRIKKITIELNAEDYDLYVNLVCYICQNQYNIFF